MTIAIALIAVAIVSLLAPAVLKPLLTRMGVVDIPNMRSSHTIPVIRGGGLAPLLAVAVGYAILLPHFETKDGFGILVCILGVSAASGLLGWLEDYEGLPVLVRAGFQLGIGLGGTFAVLAMSDEGWWMLPLYGIGIAGYINVANFMDGVNGISGLHGAVVGITYATIGILLEMPWLTSSGGIIALAFVGFLPWNLVRARLFLGDVGSYLLGGGLAIIAVSALVRGAPLVAIIGPLAIYLADSTITLARRVVRGEKWFQAHRTHVYQRLTALGLSHLQVAAIVSMASVGCGVFGIQSVVDNGIGGSWVAWLGIVAIVVAYLSLATVLARLRIGKGALPGATSMGKA